MHVASHDTLIYLAVERIRSVGLTAERFEYPARYSPRRHHRGIFGIIEGEEMRVELLLMDPERCLMAHRLGGEDDAGCDQQSARRSDASSESAGLPRLPRVSDGRDGKRRSTRCGSRRGVR